MKLLFVIHSYDSGGVTTALINMLNELSKNSDYEISLLVFNDGTSPEKLPQNIKILKAPKKLHTWFMPSGEAKKRKNIAWFLLHGFAHLLGEKVIYPYIRSCRPLDEEYDVAIAYENDIPRIGYSCFTNEFVTSKVNAKRKVAFVHNDPIKLGFSKEYVDATYRCFDKVVCVSRACMDKLIRISPLVKEKSTFVHNFIPIMHNAQFRNVENAIFTINTVCRLDNQQKRIDRIIECAALLKKRHLAFMWHIYGDGYDYEKLIQYATEKKVDDCVSFEGRTNAPIAVMEKGDVFVLASDYEAFGLVLKEALIAGCPIVTTNFEEAYEVVKDRENALIIDKNPEALADAIENLMINPEKLRSMREYIISNPETNLIQGKQFKAMIDSLYV